MKKLRHIYFYERFEFSRIAIGEREAKRLEALGFWAVKTWRNGKHGNSKPSFSIEAAQTGAYEMIGDRGVTRLNPRPNRQPDDRKEVGR